MNIVEQCMCSSIKRLLVTDLDLLHNTFPRIAIDIEVGWGTKNCHKYLVNLLNKDREKRNGFPSNTYYQLLHILFLHINENGDYGIPLTLTDANIDVHQTA